MNHNNDLDIFWILNVIWRRKWLILAIIGLALLASIILILILPPEYEATATLMIEPSEKSTASEYTVLMAGERLALTYAQIIVSQPVLEQVIAEHGLDLTITDFGNMITVQPISDTQLVKLSVSNVSAVWAVLLTNTVAEKFIDYLDTLAAESFNHSLEYMQAGVDQKQAEIDAVLADIELQNGQLTDLDTQLSELELQLTENRTNYQRLQQNAQSLESSITQYTNKIHVIEPAHLENPGEEPPYTALLLMFFDEEIITGGATYSGRISDLLAQIYAPMLRRDSLVENVVTQLELNETSEAIKERISVYAVPGTQFLELRFSDTEPSQAILIANTIASIFIEQNQRALADPYYDQLQVIESEMIELTMQMADIQDAIRSSSTNRTTVELKLERLNSELISKYTDMRELQNSYDQLVFNAERSSNTVMISEPATQAHRQLQNSFLYVVVAMIVAAVIGIGLAFLLEYLEDKLRTTEDVTQLLDQTPIGVIGHIERGQEKLILEPNSSPFVAEDFRKLSAVIRPAIENVPIHKLLVTSANPGEGKSTVAANLSIILAKTGTDVILVDADLHRPQIDFLFGIDAQSGLSELLSSHRKRLPLQPTAYSNLNVLTSGNTPDDSVEILSSPALERVLTTLTTKANLVIIDCPPILTLADASFIIQQVDGALLVVKSGTTERKAAVEAMAILKNAKLGFLGVVLNDAEARSHSYYRYYNQEHKKNQPDVVEPE